jgi:DNA polymerase III epsilon subunit-like protein
MKTQTPGVCFVDTETTGLDPDRHEIWEVGLITPDGEEHHWFLPVDLGRADAVALRIGRYHERHPMAYDSVTPDIGCYQRDVMQFAADFAYLTLGCHLAGAVVSFDEERLRKLLRANGACPEWHYHLIDVEALAIGYIAGKQLDELALPWCSGELSSQLGVNRNTFEKHTALGDARWARAIYLSVMGED